MTARLKLKENRREKRLFQRLRARIDCFLHGHRDLAPADAYGEELPERDEEKQLHYCGACGSPVWVTRRRLHESPHWADQMADRKLDSGRSTLV